MDRQNEIAAETARTVPIRPEVAMYAAFARLNYKPWYAIGEFVDNSVQSALANMEALRAAEPSFRLRVEIDVDENHIEIRDNAAGISSRDYARAFLPASPPPDTTGLSEFGLGMKAAASWFASRWSVRTSALGEDVEREITFDIPAIVEANRDRLDAIERSAPASEHYTMLSLENLHVHPKGRTVGKIKEHLRSIYRVFLRDGLLELRVNGDPLAYEPPPILHAPYHGTPDGTPVTWRKEFDLDLGDGHRVCGWAAILARASVTNAGFSIFRRRRLIQGSYGEGYRPEKVFGKPNKFVYQRLIGELEVEGFAVSHTKDGIQWEDWEDDILAWVKNELDADPLKLLDQAANYRARAVIDRDSLGEATRDLSNTIAQHLPPIIDRQLTAAPDDSPLDPRLERSQGAEALRAEQVRLDLEHSHRKWIIDIELASDGAAGAWYELAESETSGDTTRIQIRVNLGHPFMVRFVSPDGDELVPLTRLAAGLAIAEITAREQGVRQAGTLRINLNQILRSALSGPVQHQEIKHDS
jgi:hypothetical protein